ncbi:MAG: hypothetical protein HEQ37_14690 [Acidovorax sp.]|nr:hypothetical protein [Acidovorax sp.]
MWKIAVGFVVFAALAMFVIIKGGSNLDMGGEKHGTDTSHAPAAPASASRHACTSTGCACFGRQRSQVMPLRAS